MERQPRPSRGCSNRLFLLTGFSNNEKNSMIQMITSLGGKYQDTVEFVPGCTHVISAKPVRSEKYLCGCASGRWVMTPGYITQSYHAMRWLEEESYEWSVALGNGYSPDIVSAPKRWRLHVEREKMAAYNNWSVYLRVEDKHRRPLVYRRLIEAGGGRIVDPSSFTSESALQDTLTHVIVDPCYAAEVHYLAAAGIPCLKPEYLAEFLFEVKPSMVPYNSCPAVPSISCPAVPSISCPAVPRRQVAEESRTRPTHCSAAGPQQKTRVQRVEPTTEPLSQTSASGSDSTSTGSYVLKSRQPETPSSSNQTKSFKATKRKLQTVREIEEAVEARKRRKMEHREPCVPPWVKSAYKTYKSKDQEPSTSFSPAQRSIIESSIEEGEWFAALVTFQSYLSPEYHPPPGLLHQIMQEMIKTDNSNLANACLKALQCSLCLHSPSLNPDMTQVYLDSLLTGPRREVTALHRYLASTEHWDYLNHVIKLALQQSCSSSHESVCQNDQPSSEGVNSSAILLLEFLVYLIEEDFIAWRNRKEKNLPVSRHGCMIARITWPGSRNRRLSNVRSTPFKQLLKNCMMALTASKGSHEISIRQFRCSKHVMSLLNMAATYCTHNIGSSACDVNLASSTVMDFSAAVAASIIDAGIHEDPERLSLFLSNLKPQWLKVMVVQNILNQKYESILDRRKAEQLRTMSLNLQKIVDYYFWMVPPFNKTLAKPPTRQIMNEKTSGKSLLKPLG